MKTERLAGILRHLFTKHGYEGLLFRLNPNVYGMSEKCPDCGFHFDHLSNSLYKETFPTLTHTLMTHTMTHTLIELEQSINMIKHVRRM